MTGETASRETQIPMGLDELQKDLDLLYNLLSILDERLTHVLSPVNSAPKISAGSLDPGDLCIMADNLAQKRRAVSSMSDRVQAILDRLQV